MTAKAKILLLELKTVKEELAFAKERCAKLDEENQTLRENCQKGDAPADEDLVRCSFAALICPTSPKLSWS